MKIEEAVKWIAGFLESNQLIDIQKATIYTSLQILNVMARETDIDHKSFLNRESKTSSALKIKL